jgi:hypothetical protein
VLLAAAWAGGKAKEQKERLARMGDFMRVWYPNPDHSPLPGEAQALVDALPMRPFHWELEFPEVFVRKNPGFDCVVGNPPFGGKNTISASDGAQFIPLLQLFWPHGHGNSDLSAYFFLRAAEILRKNGTFGLVATNTIAQGDTRDTGLKHLADGGGITLYDATVDVSWPVAHVDVVVDVVHGIKGPWTGGFALGNQQVNGLSSALTEGPELDDPVALPSNEGQAYQGCVVLGQGFVLTPEDASGLIARNDRNDQVIQPYLGGEELNATASLTTERSIINFRDWPLQKAEMWPDLLDIVRRTVKPERDQNIRDNYRKRWWQFGEARPGLLRSMAPLARVLVCARVSKYHLVDFQPTNRVFSAQIVVFIKDDLFSFSVLQSKAHETWARALSSDLVKPGETSSRLLYSISRCFETFPFPSPTDAQRVTVAEAGRALYEQRSAIIRREQIGMTEVWNRLLDLRVAESDIMHLRQLRDTMDRAVLAAYGWADLDPADKDTILTRLRKLNAQRAAEERRRT